MCLPNVDGIIGFLPPRHLHGVVYQPTSSLSVRTHWGKRKPLHVLQLILLVQAKATKTHTYTQKINAHCVKPCQLLLQALLSRFGTTSQTQKCKNETQLDCFIQRRKCLLLGRSSGWMVTPAAEHHSYVVIHAGCSDGGHPGWQRLNGTKASHSQSQLVERGGIRYSCFPLSHRHPRWIRETYPWTGREKSN